MTTKYPRRTIYISDNEWEMANWLAGELRKDERKDVSISEVLRRLLREDYERRGGPVDSMPDHGHGPHASQDRQG